MGQRGQQRKQEAVIAGLIAGNTLEEVAQQCHVSSRTVRRWLSDPEFAAAYRAERQRLVSTATAALRNQMGEAVRILAAIAGNKKNPPSSRVSAAVNLIRLTLDAHTLEDIDERLRRLEGDSDANEQS